MAERGRDGYIRRMRVLRIGICLCAVPLLMGLPVRASVEPWANPVAPASGRVVDPGLAHDAGTMQESLSRDVAQHPGEFIVFVTEAGAKQFLAKHQYDVERETNARIASRGVVGYWQGKTIVVLPWGALKNFQ